MSGRWGLAVWIIAAPAVQPAAACELRMERSTVFNNGCEVLVGYDGATRVGPFHIGLPDGSIVTTGSCEGFVSVQKVQGSVVWLAPFHSVPARTYALAKDCRSSARQ